MSYRRCENFMLIYDVTKSWLSNLTQNDTFHHKLHLVYDTLRQQSMGYDNFDDIIFMMLKQTLMKGVSICSIAPFQTSVLQQIKSRLEFYSEAASLIAYGRTVFFCQFWPPTSYKRFRFKFPWLRHFSTLFTLPLTSLTYD